jgi:hypothetical protein
MNDNITMDDIDNLFLNGDIIINKMNSIQNDEIANDTTNDMTNDMTNDVIINDTIKLDNENKITFSNDIDALTLEYFSNYGLYNKCLNKLDTEKFKISDKKFYKKRIINATKNMVKGEFENDGLREIFNKYVFSLITHFKKMDTHEIIQKKYQDVSNCDGSYNIDISNNSELDDVTNENEIDISCNSITNLASMLNPNELLYKKNESKILTMDNFVNKKTKQNIKQPIPLKKNINLREPEFKTKGIQKKQKKENIDNV